jgi:glycosyltransferase involved in cell wall biosynthesis
LAEADILVAPRIKGVNTPMKIFPYMHSGKAVLVTDLITHNQLLTDEEVCLAEAVPPVFGRALAKLAQDRSLRERLGEAGRRFVERNHVFEAHQRRVDELYDWLSESGHQDMSKSTVNAADSVDT